VQTRSTFVMYSAREPRARFVLVATRFASSTYSVWSTDRCEWPPSLDPHGHPQAEDLGLF
jgi:hypothetical protein